MPGQEMVATLLLVTGLLYTLGVGAQGPVDDFCISCICQDGCGMTYNYWIDAGRPTVQGDYAAANYAYENCANEYECSSRAIQNYMFRYQRDCNNDGKIDCYDHASIHRLGSDACGGNIPQDYRFQIESCYGT
ncbi:uncharacterized protein CBL_13707 [Carabus blaptoides fortunei]